MKVYRVEYESYISKDEEWVTKSYTGIDPTTFTRILASADFDEGVRVKKIFIGEMEELKEDDFIDVNTLTKVLL